MELIFKYFNLALKGINTFWWRITSHPNDPYHYMWFASALLLSTGYFLFYYHKKKSYLSRVKNFIKSKRYQHEFLKDAFYLGLKFIYKPLYFGIIFVNAPSIFKVLSSAPGVSLLNYDQPIIFLDPLYGLYIFAFFHVLYFDFAFYLSHVLDHKIPWFWYFHMTHHRATVLNPLTKTRTHPIGYLITHFTLTSILVPGTLFLNTAFNIGKSTEYKFALSIIVFSLLNFIIHIRHSHIRIGYGKFLSHLFISPFMHQVHHSKNPIHYDKNFGVIFSIWDKIFGSLYIPQKNEKFKFGISGEQRLKSYTFDLYDPFNLIYRDIKTLLAKIKMDTSTKPVENLVTMEMKSKSLKSAGFTLIEMLITSVIASFIFLAGAYVSLNMGLLQIKQTKISSAEKDLERLAYTLKMLAAQAVNVRYTDLTNLNGLQSPPDGAGFVRSFRYEQDASLGTLPSATLMFFARESRTSDFSPENNFSQFRPTGVFFVRKNDVFNQNRRGSQIVIDTGPVDDNSPAVTTPITVSPTPDDMVFEHISDFILDQPQYSSGNVLSSIRVTVRSIYPTQGMTKGFDCLGPTRDIASRTICNDNRTTPFKTIEKIFTLKFINNKRDSPLSVGEFQNGLYLFRPQYGM